MRYIRESMKISLEEKYLAEGFNDYISKPIDKKELERVLNKYLN